MPMTNNATVDARSSRLHQAERLLREAGFEPDADGQWHLPGSALAVEGEPVEQAPTPAP
jgi:hypothetical protein